MDGEIERKREGWRDREGKGGMGEEVTWKGIVYLVSLNFFCVMFLQCKILKNKY